MLYKRSYPRTTKRKKLKTKERKFLQTQNKVTEKCSKEASTSIYAYKGKEANIWKEHNRE